MRRGQTTAGRIFRATPPIHGTVKTSSPLHNVWDKISRHSRKDQAYRDPGYRVQGPVISVHPPRGRSGIVVTKKWGGVVRKVVFWRKRYSDWANLRKGGGARLTQGGGAFITRDSFKSHASTPPPGQVHDLVVQFGILRDLHLKCAAWGTDEGRRCTDGQAPVPLTCLP